MPMPPPKPSTEALDRQVVHEIEQVVRALRDRGPLSPDQLREAVGAAYWDAGRFEHAVDLAVAQGRIHRTPAGEVVAT